ncbi:YciI family protein [Phytohabitans suffuscus]|uniref:YCII-related domain-containing protein n=1 Tax=Phytohabitans suffuscus TaxID=624315 RepID=A0A6F8YD23_9ACTN|nr:YciI family protein [Phytohabitans suffuscus]BCB83960.1 hypothetical protein Psuf_012730 [Phytohabitans suffuscus]
MKFDQHTVVLLVRPPDPPEVSGEEAAALQDAHLAYMAGLHAEGKVAAAGPLVAQDDERLRGIVYLTVPPEEARALYAQDPSVRAGRLAVEVMTWLVPEGLLTFTRTGRLPTSMADATT